MSTFNAMSSFNTTMITFIYESAILSAIYKIFKFIWRKRCGTSELYRVCNNAVKKYEDDEIVPPNVVHRIDLSLLYSSKLLVERRCLENAIKLPELLSDVCRKKGIELSSPQAKVLEFSLSRIFGVFELVKQINEIVSTKFDPTNEAHESKLISLWNLLQSEPLTDRISDQWKDIGFQGKNPVTDFRGMGMLGLECLHYFAKNYPTHAQNTLERSHHLTQWFSFSIVDYAVILARTRSLNMTFYQNGATKETFYKLYSKLLVRFFAKRLFIDSHGLWPGLQKKRVELDLLEFKTLMIKTGLDAPPRLSSSGTRGIENVSPSS